MRDQQIVNHVHKWLQKIVIELQLCPFAERELSSGRVRIKVSRALKEGGLLLALRNEIEYLNNDSSIETTLLIHPYVLQEFDQFNQFLNLAEGVLQQLQMDGIYQIASFHPGYRFADTCADDAANYTNRSPYPMLQLLREASVEKAIESHPDIDSVPIDNIQRMRQLGVKRLQHQLAQCAATD